MNGVKLGGRYSGHTSGMPVYPLWELLDGVVYVTEFGGLSEGNVDGSEGF